MAPLIRRLQGRRLARHRLERRLGSRPLDMTQTETGTPQRAGFFCGRSGREEARQVLDTDEA